MVLYDGFFQRSRHMSLCASCQIHDRLCLPTFTDRTHLGRHAANLWHLQVVLQRRLVPVRQPAPGRGIGPLPVYLTTRSGRWEHGCPGPVISGPCAAQSVPYVTRGWRVPQCGLRTHAPFLAARPQDLPVLAPLGDGDVGGLRTAAKGFLVPYQHASLAASPGRRVIPPPRARRPLPSPLGLRRAGARGRTLVAMMGSPWTEPWAVVRSHVRALWPGQARRLRQDLAHPMGMVCTCR